MNEVENIKDYQLFLSTEVDEAINNIIETYIPFIGDIINRDDVVPNFTGEIAYGVKIKFNQQSPLFIYFERLGDLVIINLICNINNIGLIPARYQETIRNTKASYIEDVVRTYVDLYQLTVHP